ncbi:MAG: FecR family protein [Cyclobacteriaceae bacterium]
MEKEDYLKKWLQGSLNEEEKSVFQRTDDYRFLEKMSDSLMSFKAPEYNVEAEYERLSARRSVKGKVITMNWFSPLLKVAAVLMLMAGSYFFFLYDAPTVVETLAKEKAELVLPDSSFVALNALSRLSFHDKNWKKERLVELEGEGFFKVAKGSKFDVVTSSGKVSVLGTAFNVSNRKDYFEVICYEGSVEVQSANEIVRLLPKEIFRTISGVASKEITATDDAPGWRAGQSSFQSIPFRYVIQEFERQYDVSVTARNVDTNQLFTGSFPHSDLSLGLKSIALPLNLTYQIFEDKKIILTGDIQ